MFCAASLDKKTRQGGPVDDRHSPDQLHHFAKKKESKSAKKHGSIHT